VIRRFPEGTALDETRKERNKKEWHRLKIGLFCVVAVLLTAGVTAGIVIRMYGGSDNMAYVTKFAAVLNSIEEYYIGDADMETATNAAYNALVASATDRWSYYMNEEEYEAYLDYTENQYQGIGITVQTDTEASYMLSVYSVEQDSPAALAGLEIGDVFHTVGGTDCAGMTVSALKEIIQKHVDQTLDITVERNGETVDLTVTCTTIQTVPVRYELLDQKVGYIKIKNFESGCADAFIEAVDVLLEQGATGLVFDVRGNPGGQLSELLDMLDYLLPEGEMFVSVDQSGEEEVYQSDDSCVELPMSVLIDADSYSAAEFFAAALQEYGLATTVGEATTGKGRSQITLEYTDGTALHISSKRYLTPNRVDLSEQGGLTPDMAVALTEDAEQLLRSDRLDYDVDPQLQAAVAAVQ
jgi:carboxyl-terminal processing protease